MHARRLLLCVIIYPNFIIVDYVAYATCFEQQNAAIITVLETSLENFSTLIVSHGENERTCFYLERKIFIIFHFAQALPAIELQILITVFLAISFWALSIQPGSQDSQNASAVSHRKLFFDWLTFKS